MKKNKLLFLSAVVGSLALTGCDLNLTEDFSVDTINGNNTIVAQYIGTKTVNFDVEVGKSRQLELSAFPETLLEGNIDIEIADPTVATIDENLIVRGLKAGFTTCEVASSDGSLPTKFNIFVKEGVDSEKLTTIANNVNNIYADPTHKSPRKVREIEYDYESYSKEGVSQHSYESMEEICFDADAGYLSVYSNDLKVKTKNGSSVKQEGKWIFMVTSKFEGRLFHITNSRKTYCVAKSRGGYSGEDANAQFIYDLLNMFFVSGASIATNLLDSAYGKSDFESEISGTITPNMFSTYGGNSLISTSTGSWSNQTITAVDEIENRIEIPAGTKANITQKVTYFFGEGYCNGYDVDLNYTYKKDNENWSRELTLNRAFFLDFEAESFNKPDELGFKKVDTIFDL